MAKKAKNGKSPTSNGGNLGFEAKLWAAADALRNNMDAAEYKHVVLIVAFLCGLFPKNLPAAFSVASSSCLGVNRQCLWN